MLDGILLERAGLPAVAIITEPFHETGRELSKSWGVPDFRFLEMPHPIVNMSEAELDAQCARLTEEAVALLREGQPAPARG